MKNKIIYFIKCQFSVALIVTAFLSHQSFASKFPDTIWMKVTFYDYKANGSNPNFEACSPGYQAGMIQNYLDAWRKPVFKANKACNDRVSEWYRASGITGPDTPSTRFAYDPISKEWKWYGLVNYAGRPGEWVAPHHSDNYNMTNIIIYDSLPFRLIDSTIGMYQYNNQSFFKLDGKGYGDEGKKDGAGNLHNFSFSMEIHNSFTYNGGEVFRFTGDDDVWAFINGQLAMDIGGVHAARSDSIILDNVASKLNLIKGKTYSFDFFYAERHTTASTIRITTDLFKPRPTQIIVRPDTLPINPHDTTLDIKDTTITAGQCVKFRLHVLDDTLGLRPEYDSLIQWEIFDTLGNAISFDTVADQNRICVTKAYGCIKIRLTFRDPEDATNVIRDSIQLCVQQGPAHHLLIESSPNAATSPRFDNPLRNLTIPATITKDTVFAILRDPYGNFVSPSQHTEWKVISGGSVVSVANGNNALGAGIISKLGPSGNAVIVARSTDFTGSAFTDTLKVVVSDIAYDSLRIVTGEGGLKTKITSLTITIGQDTTLKVEGHRIDGLGDHGWVSINGNWQASINIKSQTPAPSSDSEWIFSPKDTAHGTITANYSSLSSNIAVWVKPGDPSSLGLYPKEGPVGSQNGNIPYLSSITYRYQAGTSIPIVAKIFDPISVWLSSYETDQNLSQLISWTVLDSATLSFTPDMGTVSSASGFKINFTPKMAFKTYLVTATLNQGAIRLSYTMHIRATAGTPSHIVIEASPDSTASPNADNPISKLELQSTQTNQSVYAIIRDQFGNYVGHADSSLWISNDTGCVSVAPGPNSSLGQATITRVATGNSQTYVKATLGTMSDSIDVRVTSVTYDDIMIMVNNNGLKNIDTLSMRIDQDTTLFALGKRSDTKNWTSVSVGWWTGGIVTNPSAPALANSFSFAPGNMNQGKIIISKSGTGGVMVQDSIVVIFLPGLPKHLEIYSKPGVPVVSDKYPDPTITDTISAGTLLTLDAKIFDNNSVWLKDYEINPSSITWRIQELSGNPPTGTLSAANSYNTVFTPQRAYNTVYVVAELAINGTVISDMVKVYVKPSTATHVVIEPKPDPGLSPNADNPIGEITFGPKDTINYGYAILRDQFGNYIGPFTSAIWKSLDSSIVVAQSGTVSSGEGKITRSGREGQTLVIVCNSAGTLLDTVQITLNNITYDSLRIIAGDNPISQLSMRSDQDTTILVQGKRSDNQQWEYVVADWSVTGSLKTDPVPPKKSSTYVVSPTDTGNGTIIVTKGNTIPDTIRVTFTHGLPVKLVIFSGVNSSDSTVPLPSPLTDIGIIAGNKFSMTARVLDNTNVWLQEYASITAPIFWKIEQRNGKTPIDSLETIVGFKNSITSKRAYNRFYVIASFQLDKKEYSDTVTLYVNAGIPHHLVIEPNANWQISPNADNPVDSVTITSKSTYTTVYAAIRDTFGNFISYSQHSLWKSDDSTIVTVEDGITTIGEGTIKRIASAGRTIVRVSDVNEPSLTASVKAIVVNYYYEALRIVVKDSIRITSLTMTTNDDTTLSVMGRRSDSKEWENTSANWKIIGNVVTNPASPDMAHSWHFNPIDTGTVKIRVSTGVDSITSPDTILAVFRAGPPNKVRFDIITPAENRIAGDTILAIIRIENRNGAINGIYCFTSDSATGAAVYQTLLTSGTTRPPATTTVDGQQAILNKFPKDSIKLDQCFLNGIDTVRFVLYNAPFTKDSVQQLFVSLGTLKTSSESFTLLPGKLATIRLEDVRGNDLGDTMVLHYPTETKTIIAQGYDGYGNRRNTAEYCNWSTNGTLHTISRNLNQQRIYYESVNVTGNETGHITAVATDTAKPIKTDSVFVRIIGPKAKLVSAKTLDRNGNGYLDGIILTFNKKVTLPAASLFKIWNGSTEFSIDNLDKTPAESSSVFIAYLSEQVTGEPQTAWKPSVSFSGIQDIDAADSILCQDGAGPVIWSIQKLVTVGGDRKQDLVTVVFSEPVAFANGDALALSLVPSKTFTVWSRDSLDQQIKVKPDYLKDIPSIYKILSPTTLQFYLSNGNDLTDRYFMNLKTAAESGSLADMAPGNNMPADTNQRVAVIIKSDFPVVIKVAPNPAVPTTRREPAGTIKCQNNPLARYWINEDKAGVLLNFKLMPFSSGEKIKAQLKIFDAIGNIVNSASENNDIIPSEWRTGPTTVHDVDFYWNGTNHKGMTVAPGIYRVILLLESNSSKQKLIGTVGISR